MVRNLRNINEYTSGGSWIELNFGLQGRFSDHFVRSLRETVSRDGNSISDGGSHINVRSSILLRSLLPLPLHREHVFSAVHVCRFIEG